MKWLVMPLNGVFKKITKIKYFGIFSYILTIEVAKLLQKVIFL